MTVHVVGGIQLTGSLRGPWQASTTYQAYDVVIFNGGLYYAPASFTSGSTFDASWLPFVPQGELGYAQIVTSYTTPTPGVTPQDVTGLQVTVACTGRPIMVEAFAPQLGYSGTPSGTAFAVFSIFDVTGNVEVTRGVDGGPSTGVNEPARPAVRLTPAAGNRTFKAQAWSGAGLQAVVTAGTTFPAYLRVVEF